MSSAEASGARIVESDVPVVVRRTCLDSLQAENALISTVAYANRE